MERRQSGRAQQTRERLRAAALRLFLQQGYPATSIDAILAEAGISSPAARLFVFLDRHAARDRSHHGTTASSQGATDHH